MDQRVRQDTFCLEEATIDDLHDAIRAGRTTGLALLELREQLVNEEWVGTNQRLFGEPRLASHLGHPVSFGMVWARDNRRGRT